MKKVFIIGSILSSIIAFSSFNYLNRDNIDINWKDNDITNYN